MKLLHPLWLLGVASTTLAWSIDKSCDCHGNVIKDAMKEAIAIMADSAEVAKGCVPPVKGERWLTWLCHHMAKDSTILQDFFLAENEADTSAIKPPPVKQPGPKKRGDGGGDSSSDDDGDKVEKGLTDNRLTTIYHKLAVAFEAASTAAGSFSEKPDGKLIIVCGDAHLNKLPNTNNRWWKDPERKGYGLVMNPPPKDRKRPCSATDAVVYDVQEGKVLMMCAERDTSHLKQDAPATIDWARHYLTLNGFGFDGFSRAISSDLTHELIHLGNMKQYPRVLEAPGEPARLEEYHYEGAKKLRGLELKWQNADTYAMVARALWLNYYVYVDGKTYMMPRWVPKNRPGLPYP